MSSVERYRSNTYHSHACHPHLSRFDELRRNVASDTDPSPSCRQANPSNRCVHLSANSTPRDIRIQVPLKNLLKTNSRSQTSVQSSPYTFNINKSTGDAEIHEESDQKRCQPSGIQRSFSLNRDYSLEGISPKLGSEHSYLERRQQSQTISHNRYTYSTVSSTTATDIATLSPSDTYITDTNNVDDMQREDIDQIPQGAVSQKLKLFGGTQNDSRTTNDGSLCSTSSYGPKSATSLPSLTKMPQKAYSSDGVSRRSAFEILLENKKRRSDHGGTAGDGMQRGFSAVQLHNSDVCSQFSSRLPDRIPASCVLLRQSQEMLSKRKREALSKSQTEDEDDQELLKDETVMKENRVLGSSLTTVQMNRSDIECSTSMSETTRFGTMNESSDASLANAILTSRDIRVKRAINYDELHDANDNEAGTIEIPVNETNARMLIEELSAMKELNQELISKLARSERDLQSLKIQLDLQEKKCEAKFASKLADAVEQIKLNEPNLELKDMALQECQEQKEICEKEAASSETLEEWNGEHEKKTLETLLEELEGNGTEPLSPETIRKNCDRIMEYVRKNGCSIEEEDYEMTEGSLQRENRRLREEAQKLKREMFSIQKALAESQNLLSELQKPSNHFTNETNQNRRTMAAGSASIDQPIECDDYRKQLSVLRDKLELYQTEMKMKDGEIQRLELEIGNAHRCNQQLNAKIGSLSSLSAVEMK